MTKDPKFSQAVSDVMDNLQVLQVALNRAVDEGMIDEGSSYYNELLDLLEDARIVKTWEELMEIISLAKTIEVDIDAWVSLRGATSISLSWPSQNF
jgi:uncharacterized protein YjgD (DUF1641 family)